MDYSRTTCGKDAWNLLKLAVDKYSETTGSEVAVMSKCVDADETEEVCNDYLAFNKTQTKTAIYGHGSLLQSFHSYVESTKDETTAKVGRSDDDSSSKSHAISTSHRISNHRSPLHSAANSDSLLSSSFRTLKLDSPAQPLNTGASGTCVRSVIQPDLPNVHTQLNHATSDNKPMLSGGRSGRKRTKKPKSSARSEELELDEGLLFDENKLEARCYNEDLSDNDYNDEDSSESDDDDDLTPPRRFQRGDYRHQQPMGGIAASLPVNINLAWGGHHTENTSRFRDNQGPHPPLVNIQQQPTGPKLIKADKTPQLDTMMASMQALARSVTDDTSLIFGDRPRPRLNDREHHVTSHKSSQRHIPPPANVRF